MNWHLKYFKSSCLLLSSYSKQIHGTCCYCLDSDVIVCLKATGAGENVHSTCKKVFIGGPNYALTFKMDSNGRCRDVNLKYNETAINDVFLVDAESNKAQERLSMRTAQRMVRKSLCRDMVSDDILSSPKRPPPSTESTIAAFAERNVEAPTDEAQYASEMNDVMDDMLNRSDIPADYGETMVAIFCEKSQGDVIRDFAVQHIGLYAETLQMRGKYDADSAESATLRDALWNAAEETRTIVAAAAFRALADMAAFDPRIDTSRLDNRLVLCVADSSASPAARVMAAQLCGERRVAAAKPVLARIAADRRELDPLRLAAANSARLLAE